MEDLRQDLARHVRPSDGPFRPNEKVYVWVKDHNKVKDKATWIKATVVRQEGSIVTVEAANGNKEGS